MRDRKRSKVIGRRTLPRGECVLDGCGNAAILGRFCTACQSWWSRVRNMPHNRFLEYLARSGRIGLRHDFLGMTTGTISPKQHTPMQAAERIPSLSPTPTREVH